MMPIVNHFRQVNDFILYCTYCRSTSTYFSYSGYIHTESVYRSVFHLSQCKHTHIAIYYRYYNVTVGADEAATPEPDRPGANAIPHTLRFGIHKWHSHLFSTPSDHQFILHKRQQYDDKRWMQQCAKADCSAYKYMNWRFCKCFCAATTTAHRPKRIFMYRQQCCGDAITMANNHKYIM